MLGSGYRPDISVITMQQALIREVSRADLETLILISRKTYFETFAPYNTPDNMAAYLEAAFGAEQMARELADPGNTFLFAELGQQVAGYAKLQRNYQNYLDRQEALPACILEHSSILLDRFYVDVPYQGQGVSAPLMQACLDRAMAEKRQVMWLGVWEQNRRARRFYEKWGFEVAGRHRFMMGKEAQWDDWMVRWV